MARALGFWLSLLCCLVPFGLLAQASEDRSARFATIGDLDTIPDGVVTALVQDAPGFLWIGTTRGLVRYDGYEFRRFTHAPDDPTSIGGNLVRSLMLAADGRVWIGGEAGRLSVYDPRTETFARYELSDGDPVYAAASVMAMIEHQDGRVYVGTRGAGLVAIDPDDGSVHRLRDGIRGAPAPRTDVVHALAIDQDGTLWIGSYGGLRRLSGDGLHVETVWSTAGPLENLESDPVVALLPVDDRLWIGTQGGHLAMRHRESGDLVSVGSEQGTPPGMLDSIADIAMLPNREIWLARTSGLEVRAADGRLLRWIRHRPEHSSALAGNDTRALLVDRYGMIWIGGFGGGLQRHDPASRWLSVLPGEDGYGNVFQRPNIASIAERANGDIWLGSRGDGIAILNQQLQLVGGFTPEPARPGALKVGWITALAEDAAGSMWLGSRDGAHRYADGQFQRYGVESGLTSLSVRRLLAHRDRLFVGTNDGAFVAKLDGQIRFERIALASGDALGGEVNAFAVDEQRVFIAGNAGLFVLDGDNASQIDLHSGMVSVVGLLIDGSRTLWVDTTDGPLSWSLGTDDKPVQLFGVTGIEGDLGANLLADQSGRIWTHRYVYFPDERRVYALARDLGSDFGTGWFRSFAQLRDGRMLFGGSRGVLTIDPTKFSERAFDAPVIATEIRVDDRTVPWGGWSGGIRLAPGERNLTIRFAALDFAAAGSLRYGYRLLGVDDAWVNAGSDQRLATWRNLPPGQYQLAVRAQNHSGDFSPSPLQIDVEVAPLWWQRQSVRALALAGALMLVGIGVRLRFALLRRQAAALEALVDKRTAELTAAKQRAEQALGELKMTQAQLVQSEKLASLGRLVAGVAHEINTPIGIAVTAASKLTEINADASERLSQGRMTKSDLGQWQAQNQEGQTLVLRSLERASRLISSFKRVAVDQSSEERRNFDLRAFFDEVQTTFAPSFKRSPHRLVVDLAESATLDSYPGALFQVFTNLIENAVTHAFADGQSGTMRIEVLPPQRGSLEIRFSDDGSGMSEDVRSKAFEPFFTTRRDQGGSGLGLHLVHNLITGLMGGDIALGSAEGRGTQFILHVPLVAPRR